MLPRAADTSWLSPEPRSTLRWHYHPLRHDSCAKIPSCPYIRSPMFASSVMNYGWPGKTVSAWITVVIRIYRWPLRTCWSPRGVDELGVEWWIELSTRWCCEGVSPTQHHTESGRTLCPDIEMSSVSAPSFPNTTGSIVRSRLEHGRAGCVESSSSRRCCPIGQRRNILGSPVKASSATATSRWAWEAR